MDTKTLDARIREKAAREHEAAVEAFMLKVNDVQSQIDDLRESFESQ